MIAITRALARTLRPILRQSVLYGAGRGVRLPIELLADAEGLRIRCRSQDVAVEYQQPGSYPQERLVLPGDALEDFEGKGQDPVELEATGPATMQARWQDAGVPQVKTYTLKEPPSVPAFPQLPDHLTIMDGGILNVFDEAVQTASKDAARFALNRIQLKGSAGEVVATDGRQLLVQAGLPFPWTETVLIAAAGVFGCKGLPRAAEVSVGKTATHVCIRIGPWTFSFTIDTAGRYPPALDVIPRLAGEHTVVRLAQQDAAYLVEALPRLPGLEAADSPVTVDLNGHVALRSRGEGQSQATEVVLSRSAVVGPPLRFLCPSGNLARALEMGFAEIHVLSADKPVVCKDEKRTYVMMALGAARTLPPSEEVIRIAPPEQETAPPPTKPERKKNVMNNPPTKGMSNEAPVARRAQTSNKTAAPEGTGWSALLAEAQALKEQLREVHGRTSRLLAALKRHRQQSKLLQTTLTSLRQLQRIEA